MYTINMYIFNFFLNNLCIAALDFSIQKLLWVKFDLFKGTVGSPEDKEGK